MVPALPSGMTQSFRPSRQMGDRDKGLLLTGGKAETKAVLPRRPDVEIIQHLTSALRADDNHALR